MSPRIDALEDGRSTDRAGSTGTATTHSESTSMRLTFPRLVAAVVLAAGGALTDLTGFGIAVGDLVIRSGRYPVLPADARMLHDLAVAAPVLGVLGLVAFVAAIVLASDARSARALGIAVSAAGVAVGATLVALVLVAAGPFGSVPSDRVLDGIGIVGSYAAFNLIALGALIADRFVGRAKITASPA